MHIQGTHIFDAAALEWIAYPGGDAPDTFGPDGVAVVLERYRAFIRRTREETGRNIDTLGDLSDGLLRSLIRLAYRASFLSDEGRPVRCRIAVRREKQPFRIVRDADGNLDPMETLAPHFTAAIAEALTGRVQGWEDELLHQCRLANYPQLNTPKVIAKFAPLLADSGCAITVQAASESLVVTGIASLDESDVTIPILGMPRFSEPTAGLIVEILGPGHLRVSEGQMECSLFADQIVSYTYAFTVRPVAEWLSAMSASLESRLMENKEYTEKAHLSLKDNAGYRTAGLITNVDVYVMMGILLRTARGLGHGGMFVFLPGVPSDFVDLRSSLQPIRFGERMVEGWLACCRLQRAVEQKADVLTVLDKKQTLLRRWVRLLRQAGSLAAADGCVVLDHDCTLHGYGGIITADDHQNSNTKCFHALTGQELTRDSLLALHGTRHRSAYRLCERVDGAIVFVLSQDGDLKLFARVGDKVLFADCLRA